MKISFTKRAEKNYSLIKEYIRAEWGNKLEEAFEQKTKDFLDLLKDFPQMGSVEVKDNKSGEFYSQNTPKYFIESNPIKLLS
jgi:plasmid stabilization system protein ParE